ncbi:hypothetical protein [Thermobifida halotolerans]|nr:hypothetical protein [Thermobifida halotolerans]
MADAPKPRPLPEPGRDPVRGFLAVLRFLLWLIAQEAEPGWA